MSDGRSFALIDYDNDGWLDIALMSLNAPRFQLYKNQMGTWYSENRSFKFQLVGGQTKAAASSELSNRDAIGARVLVTFSSGKKIMIQKQAGEGFASQNSATLSIGVTENDSVDSLLVRWPSGKESKINKPDISNVLVIKEVE